MTHRNNHTQSNSRARDKSNKRVRANNLNLHSTVRPNTTFRSLVSKSRSMSYASVDVSPSQSCESTDEVRFADKKSAAGKQSAEVLQNAPIIERAFCRSSTENAARPRCHFDTEITDEGREYYNAMDYMPCDIVRECIDCRYFHV